MVCLSHSVMDDNVFEVLTAAAMRIISQKIKFFCIYINFRISAVETAPLSNLMQGCISVATFIDMLQKFQGFSQVKLRCKQYLLAVQQIMLKRNDVLCTDTLYYTVLSYTFEPIQVLGRILEELIQLTSYSVLGL